MKKIELKINTKNKTYSIIIGPNIIKSIGTTLIKKKISFEKVLVVIDKNIPKFFIKQLLTSLKNKQRFTLFLKASEKNKNIKSIEKIHKSLFEKNFNRNDCVISFGGGIIGDVVGFACSTYKRGLKFINIPSTLLSQVDSSVGGKTGINNQYGKNLVGSFYHPEIVFSDTNILKSLPKREIICGYAEIFKSSLIDNERSFKFLNDNLHSILSLKKNNILKAIFNSCRLKKKIVEKDEKEKNLRKVLNLGHTFAHAYEATLGYSKKLNHGEAVILGIGNSINFSKKNNILKDQKYNLVKKHLKKINLNKELKYLFKKKDIKKILSFMVADKKNRSDNINLILFKDFGKIISNYQASKSKIENFLNSEIK